ncbi:hypothetical protein BKA67DRAFT_653710 [Truncatella angustata]|uniref:Uncharacterized protein n=1 Tax=Truncatella angustata TaxID=152316 RepID=A0A9P8UXV3_9PEZI|nr:uncharacterized protein BKA67DRAFT_653710 [Truncatella angustata]KAH6660536.1 hypothetical protein BKA67DRAFT_653710 [Truncatella angustata]KAH8204405.1 hypothetical protein TruAng_001456 [Truncatella angustata]
MAAPANKTIGDLGGKWVMNKTLSDDVEPGLALQGIGWMTRKAIGLATVTLQVKQYTDAADGKPHLDIEQTATGGIKGTSEHRTLDDTPREHADWLFGKVKGRSLYIAADALPAKVKEQLLGDDFLTEGWLQSDEEKTGPGGALHVVNWVEAEAGWTVAQVWGFQTVGGERRYARNIVITNKDKKVELRLVYDFISE